MTDSCCWIDIREDGELTAQLLAGSPPGLDPAHIDLGYRYLWICDLREWAASKDMTIEYPGLGWIVGQVTVNKRQLLEFLHDMFGPVQTGTAQRDSDTLRTLIREHGNEDCRYRIFADEY
jgi:hypothetical protein